MAYIPKESDFCKLVFPSLPYYNQIKGGGWYVSQFYK
jgi:hypothetical protein